MLVPLHIPAQEHSKLRAILELSRQGFNHLASYEFTKRPREQDLFSMLIAFYKEDSPSRRLAAHLALLLRARDKDLIHKASPRSISPYKRLGNSLGTLVVPSTFLRPAGLLIALYDVVMLPFPDHLIGSSVGIDALHIDYEGVDGRLAISMKLTEKKDRTGAERLRKSTNTLKGLRKRRAKKHA